MQWNKCTLVSIPRSLSFSIISARLMVSNSRLSRKIYKCHADSQLRQPQELQAPVLRQMPCYSAMISRALRIHRIALPQLHDPNSGLNIRWVVLTPNLRPHNARFPLRVTFPSVMAYP